MSRFGELRAAKELEQDNVDILEHLRDIRVLLERIEIHLAQMSDTELGYIDDDN